MASRIGVKKPQRIRSPNHKNADPDLTEDQIKFCEIYVAVGTLSETCRRLDNVGYHTGSRWLELRNVKEEISRLRDELRKKSGYTVQLAMDEAHAAMKFAEKTENASAVVKAVELKTRLNGLLVEKHDHRMIANFSIQVEGVKDNLLGGVKEPAQLPGNSKLALLPIDVLIPSDKVPAEKVLQSEKVKEPSMELNSQLTGETELQLSPEEEDLI